MEKIAYSVPLVEVVYERDSDIVPEINPDFDPKGTHALMDLDVSDFLVSC